MSTEPTQPAMAAARELEHKRRFEHYWAGMEPIMVPDQSIKRQYEGCFTAGFIAGQFHTDFGQTESDFAALRAELAAAKEALYSAVTRAQNSGNGLYQNIVATMEPHFPSDTRDLEWDVLPSTIGAVMIDLAQLRAELAAKNTALEYIAKWALPQVFKYGAWRSYESEYGSNGARDHIKGVAKSALSANAAKSEETR